MTNYDYDLFVIGTGEAGSTAAQICRAHGWKVAIADENPFGGTCSLRGCNPKRTLAGAAELLYRAKGMDAKGITGSIGLDWSRLIEFKNSLIKEIPAMHEKRFTSSGIESFRGLVNFTDTNELSIEGKKVSAAKILIASGSKPRPLGIPGENNVLTSDQMLSVSKLPPKIVFIGAGYISMEFSHVLAAAGTKVTLLEYAHSPLVTFDKDLVKMLVQESKEAGIEIIVNSKISSIEESGNGLKITAEGDVKKTYEADLVVHGAGRIPNIDRLTLVNADVNHNNYRIRVNEYLQSISNRNVYVAGDAHAEGIQLTPVAEMEGRTAAHNMIYGNSSLPDYSAVPSVIFTLPGLAMVGVTADPDNPPEDTYIVFQDTSSRHITRRLGLSTSAFKIVVDKATNKIRGVHLLGYNVDEVINLFAMAVRSGKTIQDLKALPWTFPSVTYDTIYRL